MCEVDSPTVKELRAALAVSWQSLRPTFEFAIVQAQFAERRAAERNLPVQYPIFIQIAAMAGTNQ